MRKTVTKKSRSDVILVEICAVVAITSKSRQGCNINSKVHFSTDVAYLTALQGNPHPNLNTDIICLTAF
ncbi:MAG TPA: hypothetical protein VGN64_11205 [Dyadobacter sp.]|nr:hypothetical protein [Dyadobacter sp.]